MTTQQLDVSRKGLGETRSPAVASVSVRRHVVIQLIRQLLRERLQELRFQTPGGLLRTRLRDSIEVERVAMQMTRA